MNTTFISIHDLFCSFSQPADKVSKIDNLQHSSNLCSWLVVDSTNSGSRVCSCTGAVEEPRGSGANINIVVSIKQCKFILSKGKVS